MTPLSASRRSGSGRRLRQEFEDVGGAGAVDRGLAVMGEDDASLRRDEEVAAQLKEVVAGMRSLHARAAQPCPRVVPEYSGMERVRHTGPAEAVAPVHGPIWIAQHRELGCMFRPESSEVLDVLERDQRDGAVALAKSGLQSAELRRVLVARESVPVAKKDQQLPAPTDFNG